MSDPTDPLLLPGPSTNSARRNFPMFDSKAMTSLEKTFSLKRSYNAFSGSWLNDRQLGMRKKLCTTDNEQRSLYSALTPIAKWGDMKSGGIFNIEFSQDGSILVAACEKKSIYMFDPLSKKVVGSIPDAHTDCVNFVRFLDSRVFASCSDDTTVALWDARNLKTKIRSLQGHSNWVKNIEFSVKDDLLVTAGFDGCIFMWDINNYTETGFVYDRLFQTNGLMRMRLSPDASKMVMSTTAGYMILIHDLNLRTLSQDLMGFRPNMYRLMQLSDTAIPMAFEYHHLFSKVRKRNRVEFITDFPSTNEAEVLSSLQIHPHGWCALSRNISNNEMSEWTCVHDIQEIPDDDDDDELGDVAAPETPKQSTPSEPSSVAGPSSSSSSSSSQRRRARRPYYQQPNMRLTTENRYPQLQISTADIWEALLVLRESRNANRVTGHRRNTWQQDFDQGLRIIRMSSGIQDQSNSENDIQSPDEDEERGEQPERDPLNPSDDDVMRVSVGPPEAVITASSVFDANRDLRNRRYQSISTSTRDDRTINVVPNDSSTTETVQILPITKAERQRMKKLEAERRLQRSFVQNKPRLTHFAEEVVAGRGYIKELCFSSDGRIICSPFKFGVRLLAFNENCSDMSRCVPHNEAHIPSQLFELTSQVFHSDIVVCTKFSPTHNILASGCLSGNIVLYQPVF